MLETPVLLLAFNRPDTTQVVFDAIKAAKPKKLYFATDAPRPGKDAEAKASAQVRAIADQVDWDCEVKTLFQENNLGCRRAVMAAIDWLFDHEERGIILEDDCVPDQSFFGFCEKMLCDYATDDRVMMVSGMSYISEKADSLSLDYFYSRVFSIWGWATWRKSWNRFVRDTSTIDPVFLKSLFKEASRNDAFNRYNWFHYLVLRDQKVDSWGISWVLSCYLNNALSVCPVKNLVSNIGYDGTHYSNQNKRSVRFLDLERYSVEPSQLKGPDFICPTVDYDSMVMGIIFDFREAMSSRVRLFKYHLKIFLKRWGLLGLLVSMGLVSKK